jgi:hypothetical protein
MSNSNEMDESLRNETDEQQVERSGIQWNEWASDETDEQQLGRNDWVQDNDGAYRIVDEAEDIEIDGEITPHVTLDSERGGQKFIPTREFETEIEDGDITPLDVDATLGEIEDENHRQRAEEILARDEADQLERDEMYAILEESGYPPREIIDLSANKTEWSHNMTQIHAEVCDNMNMYRERDQEHSRSLGPDPLF